MAPSAIALDSVAVHIRAAFVPIDLPAPLTATSGVTLWEVANCAFQVGEYKWEEGT